MRIMQAYVSKSVMDFPFHEIYALDDYNNFREPAVFFGMYRFEDLRMWMDNEQSLSKIFWTGQDALNFNYFDDYQFKDVNITAHPKVRDLIKSKGHDCQLVQPAAFLNEVTPQVLGPKIYAYCPNSAPDYHGKKVIDELRCAGYEILIGDGTIPQHFWKSASNGFYNDIFIGLCLSEFAGGGGTIIEMGLRGIRVVTNVFDLPNCLSWNTTEDVITLIENEKRFIGTENVGLALEVWNNLDHEFKWLEI